MSLSPVLRRSAVLPERAGTGATALAARGISVRFGDRVVLDSVDLDVRVGEVLALVGPNGAGKSTLLSAMAGDLTPSAGEVSIDSSAIGSWSPVELAMRRAVLLQDVAMSFPFTVRQAVEMGRSPWAGHPAEDDDEDLVAEAMALTDTTELSDRVFMSLSGGERARAALARVLAQDTAVVLLDEPTAALDIRHQEQVMGITRARADRGDAVVVVMHDLGLAAAHADRVVVLSNGRIRAVGPAEEVMTAGLLSDVYECDIDIVRHPRTGAILITPTRG